jgi:hypothetical protein
MFKSVKMYIDCESRKRSIFYVVYETTIYTSVYIYKVKKGRTVFSPFYTRHFNNSYWFMVFFELFYFCIRVIFVIVGDLPTYRITTYRICSHGALW